MLQKFSITLLLGALWYLQYVHDDPEGPDITGLVILLRPQDLRGWGGRVNIWTGAAIKQQEKRDGLTYRRSRECSRGSGGCPACGFPWQTQSLSTSAHQDCLKWELIKELNQTFVPSEMCMLRCNGTYCLLFMALFSFLPLLLFT